MTSSLFTPSLQTRATLESTFVVRHHLLDLITSRIQEAANSPSRNHTLLVGIRGSGKTHLAALAYYRTRDLIDAGARLQVAWLPEDPWTLVSYRRLLTAILVRLEPENEIRTEPHGSHGAGRRDAGNTASIASRQGTPEPDLESRVLAAARRFGPIVVIVENLDRVLDQIDEIGQQQLRHLLQQGEAPLLLVATTTRLSRSLSDQSAPFYGFFTSTRVPPFTVENARSMLQAVARRQGDIELARQLDDCPFVLPRLLAISQLAGGQPRLWAALSSRLTIERLDSLTDLLLTTVDDLTPYYQEQLAGLSRHQRLTVAELASLDHPMHVAQLAGRLDIDQRSLAKSISDLVDRGWLASIVVPYARLVDRRRTYYELADPLALICLQIKEPHGQRLWQVTDLLRCWFDPHFARPGAGGAETAALLGTADDALAALQDHDPDPLLRLPASLRAVIDSRLSETEKDTDEPAVLAIRRDIHTAALATTGNALDANLDTWISRAENLVLTGGDAARLILRDWLTHAGRTVEADALQRAIAHSKAPSA